MSERQGILWFVLDEASSERLRQAVPPRFATLYYHHMTLQHGVGAPAVEQYIGKPWTVEAYAAAYNDEVQACRVRADGLPDMYGVPHITLSTAPGVKPFASVAMLQGKHEEAPIEPLPLTGTVAFEYLDTVQD